MIGENSSSLSLDGKIILVTGVSRATGIGAEITRVLANAGAKVITHGYGVYDQSMQYSDADPSFPDQLAAELLMSGNYVKALGLSDLSKTGAAEDVVKQASSTFGYLDGLVINHAYSTHAPIGCWTSEHIDQHLQVNVRATMLMIQAFARQLPKNKRGAITLFTSGQYLGPMIDEIAYAVSKEAIIGLSKQASYALADQNIQVNCINPGPTDTGYLSGEDYQQVARCFPSGKWGSPVDAARLVHFLQSDYSSWITGETIASEGGFRR